MVALALGKSFVISGVANYLSTYAPQQPCPLLQTRENAYTGSRSWCITPHSLGHSNVNCSGPEVHNQCQRRNAGSVWPAVHIRLDGISSWPDGRKPHAVARAWQVRL